MIFRICLFIFILPALFAKQSLAIHLTWSTAPPGSTTARLYQLSQLNQGNGPQRSLIWYMEDGESYAHSPKGLTPLLRLAVINQSQKMVRIGPHKIWPGQETVFSLAAPATPSTPSSPAKKPSRGWTPIDDDADQEYGFHWAVHQKLEDRGNVSGEYEALYKTLNEFLVRGVAEAIVTVDTPYTPLNIDIARLEGRFFPHVGADPSPLGIYVASQRDTEGFSGAGGLTLDLPGGINFRGGYGTAGPEYLAELAHDTNAIPEILTKVVTGVGVNLKYARQGNFTRWQTLGYVDVNPYLSLGSGYNSEGPVLIFLILHDGN